MSQGKAVAIIHARGGSKRIPLKNIAMVGGKPLLAYPIELCLKCPLIGRVVVSTDHDEIMAVAREHGAEVPFRRPADISEDVPSELVTKHALDFLVAQGEALPEYAVTITPATPFTPLEKLMEGFALLQAHPEWDAVTTVRFAEEYPEWMLNKDPETGEMSSILGNPMNGEYNVSQNLKRRYYPVGAFWLHRVKSFMDQMSLYGERWGAVEMSPDTSLDIDWPAELARAQEMFGK